VKVEELGKYCFQLCSYFVQVLKFCSKCTLSLRTCSSCTAAVSSRLVLICVCKFIDKHSLPECNIVTDALRNGRLMKLCLTPQSAANDIRGNNVIYARTHASKQLFLVVGKTHVMT